MIQRMLEEIQSKYVCEKQDADVFEKVVIDGATFHIHAYNAKGLGRVATVEMKRLIGFWDMQSLIITPFEKDMPIYYYNRHRNKGSYICHMEVFGGKYEQVDFSVMADVLEKYANLPEETPFELWYDEYKLPVCAIKKVAKNQKEDLSPMVWDHFKAYMDILEAAPVCKPSEKKKRFNSFVKQLSEQGGIAVVDIFNATYNKQVTEKLAYEVLFGLK